ncbi:tripartite tricarboxylate transporter permease [uncultured Tateyamaria sp.]|uniref:tripartite tricarboxylate transporter permease n=1 Tax=uncultured Tateyamaria sp. TaxID=455651 RepID=UPI002636F1E4|nr:tripartite tricarboxylate transporter permease [uncultured Tateyamaria sp.]
MDALGYVWLGILAVFQGPEAFALLGVGVSVTLVMVCAGFLLGIVAGATPGLGGPIAMAISLPILISAFGFTPDALLPVMGFLIGIMKGATIGGAVPAILFNTPGTPDSYMTTLDGYPMAMKGQARRALRIAHLSSASGDTFSDIVLILCAPFLALMVEAYLDLPEKTALLILSLSFIAAVVGGSPGKGLISAGLGLLAVYVGTGEDFYPRLSMGTQTLNRGFPIAAAVLGVLILGTVFHQMAQGHADRLRPSGDAKTPDQDADRALSWPEVRALMPTILRSSVIGTVIGALPGIGSTLAATIGYTSAKARHDRHSPPDATAFGTGAPRGIAATEAANSSVSGANLIPVLSLGIPGNTAAVFLILAAESIGGFNPGPSVFRFTTDQVNPELVIAFGLFTCMFVANLMNWTVGGVFMRSMGFLARVPRHRLLPVVLVLTLTAIYVQETRMEAVWFTLGFGVLGFGMRLVGMSPLPFVIAFILGAKLEDSARQSFSATGGDPWFLFTSPVAAVFMALSVLVVVLGARRRP